jgi:hypothetical protein
MIIYIKKKECVIVNRMGYIPPQLRDNPEYKPKDLSYKKQRPVIDYCTLKTKEELFAEYQKTNNGKADSAWDYEK